MLAMLGLFRSNRKSRKQLKAENGQLLAQVQQLTDENARLKKDYHFTPGHYYSTIANLDEVRLHHDAIFKNVPRELAGIDLNEAHQQDLFNQWKPFFPEADFPEAKQE